MARWVSWLTLALLIVSFVSGTVLLFAYHSHDAFESVQKITFLIPSGIFFRKLHYFSSELFIFLLIGHIFLELFKSSLTMRSSAWVYGVIGALIAVVLMFSGFVLKADQNANAAAQVAFRLLGDTPILCYLSPLLRDTASFYHKFYIWHIVLLPLLLGYSIYRHSKNILPKAEYIAIATALSMLVLLAIAMPNDIILNQPAEHLKGPWFFWGAENLLQTGFSSSLVTLIMGLPFVLLIYYPWCHKKIIVKLLLTVWITAYTLYSMAWWL